MPYILSDVSEKCCDIDPFFSVRNRQTLATYACPQEFSNCPCYTLLVIRNYRHRAPKDSQQGPCYSVSKYGPVKEALVKFDLQFIRTTSDPLQV